MAAADAQNRYQSLALLLPIEVKIVESYITWMEELAGHVEKSALSKTDSLDDYIQCILEEAKAQRNEDGCDDEDSDWGDNVGHVASKMNIAAMYTYVGDYESAKAHLELLKGECLERLNLSEKHKEVIIYFRDSLAWAIRVLMGLEKDKDGSTYPCLIKGSSKLNVQWETLSEDGDDQIRATLAFLKACLSAAMKVPEQVTLDLILEATNLDPDCFIWFHYAYRITRRIRRNIKRDSRFGLRRPSEDEERLAKRAFDLCPTDVVALTDYALLLKETLWVEKSRVWEKREDDYLKCAQLFERALDEAIKTGNKKWSRKVKIYLAEFLVFGKGPKLDQDAGKRMFDECAIEYPTSTFVLHKVGKLYHHGLARSDGKYIDLNRAKECYLRAIESNPNNYACLMDYLKLLQKMKQYQEMITAIDMALEKSKRDFQVSKLKIAKGYITWIWNPLQLPDRESVAVDLLMYVVKNLPEFAKDVFEHPPHVVKKEVMQYLESVKKNCSDEKEMLLLETFIAELSKSFNQVRYPNQNRNIPNRKPRESGDGGDELTDKMQGLSMSSRTNRQNPMKEGGNWRKKRETFANGDENKESGRQPRRSKADEDQEWRKKD